MSGWGFRWAGDTWATNKNDRQDMGNEGTKETNANNETQRNTRKSFIKETIITACKEHTGNKPKRASQSTTTKTSNAVNKKETQTHTIRNKTQPPFTSKPEHLLHL